MHGTAQIAAQMLKEARRIIAEAVCAHLAYSQPDSATDFRSATPLGRIEQAENVVHVLAACLSFASPSLWCDYVRWISSLPKTVSPLRCDFSGFLNALIEVVEFKFPTDVSRFVETWIRETSNLVQEDASLEAPLTTSNRNEQLQREYLGLLLAANRNDALRVVLDAVNAGIAIESIYLDVIQPTQRELGLLWQAGKISVAQEHYCTAATQFVMAQLHPYFVTTTASERTLVATCVGDELHEVGLRIVADLFEMNGWNTIYLGANTTPDSIAETIASNGAHALAVSITMTQHLFELADVISVVRAHQACDRVKVLVGGYPFNVDPFLWRRLDVDASATDAKLAIRVVNQLVGLETKAFKNANGSIVPISADEHTSRLQCDTHDDLSRLNNNLITLQRKLSKTNAKLASLSKTNEERAEALQRADRRKNEFLAMLAHELRGPLAPMELAVSLLQMDTLEATIAHEAKETMKRQLQHMKHLINDLLDAARIVHGKIALKKETLELASVVHRAVEIVRPLIDEKQQTLELDLTDEAIKLEGDEIRLAQVFANLLTNASKYTKKHGTIRLSTNRVRDEAVVEVRDNGIGIEPELLPDVFAPFSQEQRSKQYAMGGLGLGLSLVRKLVELHGGCVNVASEGADRGSTFSVSLPTLEPKQLQAPDEFDDLVESGEDPPERSVLIVEDVAGIARMTAIIFEKLGHAPMVAYDGATAIKMYKESRPDIVILDLTLPDMSGLDLIRAIRRLDQDNSTLIVALTGHSDDAHRRLAQESGCDEYLVKPADLRELKQLSIHAKLMRER